MGRGLDVSSFQGAPDWAREKGAGVTFAYAKFTEGLTFNDPRGPGNRISAERAGVAFGAYHFADPDLHRFKIGARAEAAHFARVYVHPKVGELEPVLDLERGAPTAAWALAWLERVHELLDVEPMLYASPSFLEAVRARSSSSDWAELVRRFPRLWLASYGPNDGRDHGAPSTFLGFRVVVHQFTSRGHETGVIGDVDEDALLVPLPLLQVARPPRRAPRGFFAWAAWRIWGKPHGYARPAAPARIPLSWWRLLAALRRRQR